MSMELHVAFTGTMPSTSAIEEALSGLELPYSLVEPPPSLEAWSGYLPFLRNDHSVGVELDVFEGADAVRDAIGNEAPAGADRLAAFRWGGELDEMAVAYAAAAALASLVGGMIFEPSEGTLLSVEQAVATSHEAIQAL
jgi:hypothetical protein